MGKDSVVRLPSRGVDCDPLTELIRTGARQLIQRAVEAELLRVGKSTGRKIDIVKNISYIPFPQALYEPQ